MRPAASWRGSARGRGSSSACARRSSCPATSRPRRRPCSTSEAGPGRYGSRPAGTPCTSWTRCPCTWPRRATPRRAIRRPGPKWATRAPSPSPTPRRTPSSASARSTRRTGQDRLRALLEARRALKPGVFFGAVISRFASLLDGLVHGRLEDPAFAAIVRADLLEGQHRNPSGRPDGFTTAYFHHVDEQLPRGGARGGGGVRGRGPVLAPRRPPEAARPTLLGASACWRPRAPSSARGPWSA